MNAGAPGLRRRWILAWVLYDFANSVYPAVIQATVFSVYFTNVVVGNERGLGDLWWGRAISTAMLFVALTSPLLGAVADQAGVRKRMMAGYAAACIGAVALFATLDPGELAWAFALAVIANIGFEGSLVFYNAYLPDIAPRERHGWVSGLGFGVGYASSALGLLMVLPLVRAGRFDAAWLAVAAFYAVFAIPTFWGLPPDVPGPRSVGAAAWAGLTGFRRILADVWRDRPLRRFLLSYFVYVDGVNTTIYFASIFAATTLGFAQEELIYLFLVVQCSALVGALAWARPTDTWGPKRVLDVTLLLWTAIAAAAYFVASKPAFFALAVLAGTGLGAVQAASRAFMAGLTPDGKEAEMFGFYAFCGKSSSILGPLVFGTVSYLLGGNQRAAVVAVGSFFLIGLALLQRVPDPRRRAPAEAAP